MMKLLRQTIPFFAVLFVLILFGLLPSEKAFANVDTIVQTKTVNQVQTVSQTKVAAQSQTTANADSKIQHIYDKAELLSTSEREDLENMCIKYSKTDNLDIIILTHNDGNAVYAEKYISDFYDKMLYKNCIILLVDMANRDVYIEDYGDRAMSIISSKDIDTIVDKITPSLSNGVYDAAFKKYIKAVDNYVYPKPIYQNVWIHLLIAILIGIIAVSTMAYNAGGRMTANGSNYIDPNHSGLIGRRDDYIRTQVTRIRKPQNNGGGNGGGGGGISAGGNSYNGGGGKF